MGMKKLQQQRKGKEKREIERRRKGESMTLETMYRVKLNIFLHCCCKE